MRLRHFRIAVCQLATPACLAALLLAGCGEERQPRPNVERPALAVKVSVFITGSEIRIAPERVGGGLIELLTVNRSGKARSLVLETTDAPGGAEPGTVAVKTTPISPGETSHVQARVEEGSYEISAGPGLEPAALTVGHARPGSSDQLLTP